MPCALLTVKIKVVQILVVLAEKEFQTERLTGFAHAHKVFKKRSSSNTSGNKFFAYFHYLFLKTPSSLLKESELNLCDNSCIVELIELTMSSSLSLTDQPMLNRDVTKGRFDNQVIFQILTQQHSKS